MDIVSKFYYYYYYCIILGYVEVVVVFIIIIVIILLLIYFLFFISTTACFGLTGAGFVYNKEPTGWILNQSYPSPAGHEGHFGYAVDINANYSAIGAYGFGKLLFYPIYVCFI